MAKQKPVTLPNDDHGGPLDWTSFAQAVLSCVSSAIVLADARGTIRHCNAHLERLFGYDSGELNGKRINVLMPPYEAQHHDQYLRDYLHTRRSEFVGRGPRELVAQRKDGTNFSVQIAVQAIDMDGAPMFVAAIDEVRDEIQQTDLSRVADHDLLTGLHNAYYFEREFERLLSRVARGQSEPCALLYLDIDGFRGFNDRYGHAEGDRLLNEFGAHVARRCRKSDMSARLHADKFAVLLYGIRDEFYGTVAEAFRTRLTALEVGAEKVGVSVTAILLPLTAELGDFRKALARVEDRCRQVKQKGGNLSSID